jgi:hypothetical protein
LQTAFALPGDFHNVADLDPYLSHIFRTHASIGPAHILGESLADFELERLPSIFITALAILTTAV